MRKNPKIFLVCLLTLGVLIGWPALRPAAAAAVTSGVIRVSRANVRKTPHRQSLRIFSLRRRDKVQILKERDGWFYIASDEGQCGWVSSSLVKVVKPSAIKPVIKVFSDNLNSGQKSFIDGLVEWMRTALAEPEPRQFEFLISRISEAEKKHKPGAGATKAEVKSSAWLLALHLPFSREIYRHNHAPELESGTVDLLLYQKQLQVLLEAKAALVAEIEKKSSAWAVSSPASSSVEALLVLKSENGDQVVFSGLLENGSPVFKDSMILEIHGFSPFSVKATIPANVTDFNQFDLPAPYLADGNRSTAALAYDFFGFAY